MQILTAVSCKQVGTIFEKIVSNIEEVKGKE
jgi:hypothetical protein